MYHGDGISSFLLCLLNVYLDDYLSVYDGNTRVIRL